MGFVHVADELGTSGFGTVNFLWKDDERPIYVMDNHLAALWCWLEELTDEEPYSLVHVDYHWDDCAGFADLFRKKLSFQEFLRKRGGRSPAAMFDNYIEPLPLLRPGADSAIFVVHQPPLDSSASLEFKNVYRYRGIDGLQWLRHCEGFQGRVLVNLDLDFFFCEDACVFTDEFMCGLVTRLLRSFHDAIWTIAWSPECCGGWPNVARVNDLLLPILGSKFTSSLLPTLPIPSGRY